MWAFLLSKPDSWEVNVTHLVRQGDMSERQVRKTLRELADLGYIVRTSRTGVRGRFDGIETEVHEVPLTEESPGGTGSQNVPHGVTRENDAKALVGPEVVLPSCGPTVTRSIAPVVSSESLVSSEKDREPRKPLVEADAPTTLDLGPDISLCEHLARRIATHAESPTPRVTPAWLKAMRLLRESGPPDWPNAPIPVPTIHSAIDFVFDELSEPGPSGFCWANQIQSPTSLRAKWPKLALAKKSKQAKQSESLFDLGRRVFQNEEMSDREALSR
jgi:hypothetical protein